MHLLNARTLTLSDFIGDQIPKYVILSHTWGSEEVTFEHITNLRDRDVHSMHGMKKIKFTCEQAIVDGYDWVWIDTCCIDKSSSAELSEAINSMYAWYAHSAHCYAYLADVDHEGTELKQDLDASDSRCHPPNIHIIRGSRWFTRGWTLQELLAPQDVRFFSKSGAFLGTKQDLMKILVEMTGIPAQILADPSLINSCSISMRMTWVKDRQTTRQEDLAYCLLGLFDVKMPLLYGEGRKAFHRLQRVILEASDDETLLAWEGRGSNTGPLAMLPSDFTRSSIPSQMTSHDEVPVLTSRGLTMQRVLYRCRKRRRPGRCSHMMRLNCKDSRGSSLYLLLSPAQTSITLQRGYDTFSRKGCGPISDQELEKDWEHLGTRDLTISWGNSTSSMGERNRLQFTLYQEHYPRRGHGSFCRTTKIITNDLAHDILLRRTRTLAIEASTRYPSFGLYTSLFRFRLEVDRGHTAKAKSLELVIEIDHTGTGSAYLYEPGDQVQSSDSDKLLQRYLQDVQEFISLHSCRPSIDQKTFQNIFLIQTHRDSMHDPWLQESKITVDPSFADKLPHDEKTAQQLFERRKRIRFALADPERRHALLPGSSGIASASFIKLQDSWLFVEVDWFDETLGLGVNIWRLLFPPEEGSYIASGEILI